MNIAFHCTEVMFRSRTGLFQEPRGLAASRLFLNLQPISVKFLKPEFILVMLIRQCPSEFIGKIRQLLNCLSISHSAPIALVSCWLIRGAVFMKDEGAKASIAAAWTR